MTDTADKPRGTDVREPWPTDAIAVDPAAIRDAQRGRILDAAVPMFAKRGYDGTSAERICKAAKVSWPTFRKHFRDKEECFLAAFDRIAEKAEEKVSAAAGEAEGGWPERVAAALAALLRAIAEDPAEARVCLVEALTAGPAGMDRYDAALRRAVPALQTGREVASDDAVLPPVLEETVLGGVAWVIHQAVARGEGADVEGEFAGLLVTLLTPYLGADEAQRIAEDA